MLKLSSKNDANFDYRSVCDLWTVNGSEPQSKLNNCLALVQRHTSIPRRCWRIPSSMRS